MGVQIMEQQVPEQLKHVIADVIELLKSDNLPQVIAKTTFPKTNKPLSAWSLTNRLICVIDYIYSEHPEMKNMTATERQKIINENWSEAFDKADYRGFNQWKEIKRHVNKGAKASFILAPLPKKYTKRFYEENEKRTYLKKGENAPEGKKEETETIQFIAGFKGVPVFNSKDTEGKAIKYTQLKLPQFPFLAVAESMNIKIIPQSGNTGYYGAFSPNTNTIVMCTPDETTFFHELAHAVDNKLQKEKTGTGLHGGQQVDQEVIAQFSANVLAHYLGKEIKQTTAYTKEYLENYAGKNYEQMLFKVMSRVEAIIDYITNFKQAESPTVEAEKKQDVPLSNAEKIAEKPSQPEPKVINKSIEENQKIQESTPTPIPNTPNNTEKETKKLIKPPHMTKKEFDNTMKIKLKKELDALAKDVNEMTTSDIQGAVIPIAKKYDVDEDYCLEYISEKIE